MLRTESLIGLIGSHHPGVLSHNYDVERSTSRQTLDTPIGRLWVHTIVEYYEGLRFDVWPVSIVDPQGNVICVTNALVPSNFSDAYIQACSPQYREWQLVFRI